MALRRLSLAAALVAGVVALAGCAEAEQTAGAIPASASLAPADAVAYATVTTDADSDQWQAMGALLDRIPGARKGVSGLVQDALAEEGLDWERDVAPALGPELVVVATAKLRPVVLLQPESEEKLQALLERSDEDVVRAEVGDWVALAQKDADLTEYRTALDRGTLEDDAALAAGLQALPEESLGKVWLDLEQLTDRLGVVQEALAQNLELGIDWLSMAVAAEENGLLLAMGMRAPGSGDSTYEPELFARVPGDAVVALSFGGTQATLEKLRGQLDVGELSRTVEQATGVSLNRVFDALSGEGVVYVRPAEPIPDVTVALAPPDPDETWATVDRVVRTLAKQANVAVATATENGLEVSRVVVEDVTVRYARLDADTVVVTTGADALRDLAGGGPKLVDSAGYRRAAEDVGLEGRTRGFAYIDVDEFLPLVMGFSGTGDVPPDVQEGIDAVDSVIFQADGDGDTTHVRGFVRLND